MNKISSFIICKHAEEAVERGDYSTLLDNLFQSVMLREENLSSGAWSRFPNILYSLFVVFLEGL